MTSAQSPDEPRRAHSTHDFTSTTDEPRREVWADVKSPGGGRTYSVGTIEVEEVDGNSTFSFQPIALPPSPASSFSGSVLRQIVVLQAVGDDQGILWQRFFYGNSNLGEGDVTAGTNARAVSVWNVFDSEGDLDLDATRISISGETYDRELPLSQAGAITPWSQTRSNGFIAVYDGNGTLQWTHHFFGTGSAADSAITDLSIRVETRSSQLHDVVTYCGISSHGLPSSAAPLTPLLPFAATGACSAGVSGGSNNGIPGSQWDGIVGRISRSQAAMSTTVAEFHSIVGGTGQDGLFGIAELTTDVSGLVGSTSDFGTTASSFPFKALCLDGVLDYCVGVVMVFDSSAVTAGTGSLVLVESKPMGTVASGVHTVARDIAVVPDVVAGLAHLHIVGSTDDPDFQNTTVQGGFQNSPGGGVDGFHVVALDLITINSTFAFINGSWFGGTGDQGLTGVASWPEFPDHVVLAGYDLAVANGEIAVASIFRDTTQSIPPLVLMRESRTGGSQSDLPARMGVNNATTTGLAFEEHGLGSPAGGGVAMGPTARVHVVGATDSDDYPVSGSPFPGRSYFGDFDGIRTVFDMLPLGVSRTDGTGSFAGNVIAPLPTTGDGGTTPVACRTPYGIRPGSVFPDAKRILLDYEGLAPAQGVAPAILVDRPHIDSVSLVGAVIDVGFPLTTPVVINQMETWLNSSTSTTFLLPWTTGLEESLRWQLGTLPSASLTITLQFVVLLNNTLPCGGANLQSIASPALTIDY
jgi:hypothetical protein